MSDAYDHITATDTNTLGGRREATGALIGRARAPGGGDAARALRASRGSDDAMQKNFKNHKNNKQLQLYEVVYV